jgi:glutamate dehydrogenase
VDFNGGTGSKYIVAILMTLSILTWRQTLIWKDSISLWDHALRIDPYSYLPYNNRGAAKAEKGDLAGAIERLLGSGWEGEVYAIIDQTTGKVVTPPDVVRRDGDDAYLVVAADKGTATFSDIANEISAEYGFWLGDAFASGGSAGYDHKAMGITARGAWESVKRHFRELGLDVMNEPFTVLGIGDMSGDVFGNGMLLSRNIKLVCAFDHRNILVDPDPDLAVSFAERQRLFLTPGSSWNEYDRTKLSAAGDVFDRKAKSVLPSPQVRAALGIPDDAPKELTPNDLIHWALQAPVDLLWNGGIGTYVKAANESNADVGDRTNDMVRVDGKQVRARVVAEGGNLGFTQRGRIEFAQAGGRINTDFIDNSAGVDTSDHEVNLKILLGLAIAGGELTLDERNTLLQECASDVVDHVLYDNYLQAQILSQETEVSAQRIEAYEDMMRQIELEGELDREVEFLPSSEEMKQRRMDGLAMVRPELAVLLAYAKRSIAAALLRSDLPDSPYLTQDLDRYFPPNVVERFGRLIPEHRLKRELVATMASNDVVNSQGVTFVSRMVTETGSRPSDVVRAFRIARDVTVFRLETTAESGTAGASALGLRPFFSASGLSAENRGERTIMPSTGLSFSSVHEISETSMPSSPAFPRPSRTFPGSTFV